MQFIRDTNGKPTGVIGRASDQPDSGLSDIRSARDSDGASDGATNGYDTRCQRDRRSRPNGDRDVGARDGSTVGDSDSSGEPDRISRSQPD